MVHRLAPAARAPQNTRHRGTAHLLALPPARCSLSVLLLPLVQEPAVLGVQVGGVRSEGLRPVGSTGVTGPWGGHKTSRWGQCLPQALQVRHGARRRLRL